MCVCVPDILFLVLLCDLNVSSVWFQLVRCDLPKNLLIHREEHLQTTLLNVVVSVYTHIHKCTYTKLHIVIYNKVAVSKE